MDTELLKKLLIEHEGCKYKVYRDTKGIETIGVGHNLEANPLSPDLDRVLSEYGMLPHEACIDLLEEDIEKVVSQVQEFPWFDDLSNIRQSAICDMVFNLGIHRFKGFHNLIAALASGDFEQAAKEMLDSLWAEQVGHRADTLALMIENDEA